MPDNYSIQFGNGAGSNGSAITPYTGQSSVENATALGITMRIKGSFINESRAIANGGLIECAAGKITFILKVDLTGGTIVQLLITPDGGSSFVTSATLATSAIDNTKWYTVKMWWDSANATKQGLVLYDDTNTAIINSTGATNTALNVFAGFGNVALNYNAGVAGSLLEVDWAAVWDSAANIPAGAPTEPAASATGLLALWSFNEGTGASATDTKNGWVATVSGTYSWQLLSAAAGGTIAMFRSFKTLGRRR